jgi:hypothetical protein
VEKRYQVFISSTRKDLEEERRTVADILLRGRYIPIGMEQFSAAPEDAWSLIQRYIDECDYYVVIIAGTYGSTRDDGISYTESEYDYAVSVGKPVLAFIHENPGTLRADRVEIKPSSRRALQRFREKIERSRVRDTWNDRFELAYKVSSSLDNLIRESPGVGWIRGNEIPEHVADILGSVAEPSSRLGIARVSTDGDAGDAIRRHLAEASDIRVMATSAFRIFDNYRAPLTAAVALGADVRVLVPEADSMFLRDVEESEEIHGTRGLSLATEIEILEARVHEVVEEARSRRGEGAGGGEIGYFTTHLRSSMILCDDSWGWLTVTLPPFRAVETMSLELRATGSEPLLVTAGAHFDRCWEIVRKRGKIRRFGDEGPSGN